jgi:4-hydroxy-4-methyl-2-oxoglutarate aldolase
VTVLTPEQLKAIQEFDTCAILNAIETFGMRLRNEGYARPGLQWMFPSIRSMIGYACTMRVKSSNPPIGGNLYTDRTDWWHDIAAGAGLQNRPCIAAVEDIDETSGIGSVAGGVHAAIMQRLGCTGLVTNGSVRDLCAVEETGFAFLAGSVSPSHAYGHMVDHNGPIDLFGLNILPGDLLYADRHGLISIPLEIAADLPGAATRLGERDRRIIDFCRSPHFSLEQLEDEVR